MGLVPGVDSILRAAEEELGIVTHASEFAGELGAEGSVTAGQCLCFMQAEAELQEDLADIALAEGGEASQEEARKRRLYAKRLRHYAGLLRRAGVVPEPLCGGQGRE